MNDKLTVAPRKLLARVLEQPKLVQAVQALEPRALLGLIEHIGLEDAGEIVALATVPQLERMFDEDLWRSGKPGDDERFDPERFQLWLEVMLEAGEAFTADKLAELPEELVMLALETLVLVIDLDELVLTAVDPEFEKALEDFPNLEFGSYRVVARGHDGWDALSTALVALDERQPDFLRRLLERLCHANSEWIADNGGLHHVLTSPEMLQEDAAADREARRSRSGHVDPASARAFLKLPAGDVEAVLGGPRDAVTRAYFREYREEGTAQAEAAQWVDELSGEKPSLLLEGPAPTPETLLERTLAELDGELRSERLRELAYLSNVLLAGESRRLRPLEAAKEVLAVCNAGLVRAAETTGKSAAELLAKHGCEKLFRLGR